MLTVEEITAWTTEEILAEIRERLPKGWLAECSWSNEKGYWTVQVFKPNEEGQLVVEQEESNMDERLALLNTFGAFWFKSLPSPASDSPWIRRSEVTVQSVTRKATQSPDPEDLDPQEIQDILKQSTGD